MYHVKAVGRYEEQPFPDLFATQQFEPFNPNPLGLGKNLFDNCTRQQIKNFSNTIPECNSVNQSKN